jgi:hypothetical protein
MSRVQLPNNEEAIIADFALESTAQMMLAQLAKLNGNKDWEKLVEHAKQNAKDQEAFQKLTKDFQKELLGKTGDLVDEVEKSGKKAPGQLPSVSGNTGGNTAGSVGKAADAAAASLDGFNKGAATGEKIFANMYAISASAIILRFSIFALSSCIISLSYSIIRPFLAFGFPLIKFLLCGLIVKQGIIQFSK